MTENQQNAEKYLDTIRIKAKEIYSKRQELEALRWKAAGVGAMRYDKDKVQTSPQNYLELAIADVLEIEKEIAEDEAAIEDVKGTAYRIVRVMADAEQRTVIEWFYLNGLPMYEVARKMHMSKRNAYYLKDNALESFGKILK